MKNSNIISAAMISSQLASMMKFQHETNVITAGPEYMKKPFSWDTAIFVELGELIESVGYKWWKESSPDLANAKVEVVDVWHFLMSKLFRDSHHQFPNIKEQIDLLSTQFAPAFIPISLSQAELEIATANQPFDSSTAVHYSKLLMKRIMNSEDFQVILIAFMELCASVRMSFGDLFSRYMVKNALNNLRQAHGYKEGTYQKMWVPHPAMNSDKILEDNAVAYFLVESNTTKLNTYEDIYAVLLKYYVEMVAAEVKTD